MDEEDPALNFYMREVSQKLSQFSINKDGGCISKKVTPRANTIEVIPK